MAKLLLIAACCFVAVIVLMASVKGEINDCERRCKANCAFQHNTKGRKLKPCEQKCEKQALSCVSCSTPRKCFACAPGYTMTYQKCIAGPTQPSMQIVQCLAGIQVIYSDVLAEPRDIIKDVTGKNDSISHGFKGFYVWLIPAWQPSRIQAATNINIIITNTSMAGYLDLGYKDGTRYYRYLDLVREDNMPCIGELALWRAENSTSTPDQDGWQGYTTNINKRRRGDHLYLSWNYA